MDLRPASSTRGSIRDAIQRLCGQPRSIKYIPHRVTGIAENELADAWQVYDVQRYARH